MTKDQAKELLEELLEVIADEATIAARRESGDYENWPDDKPARDRLLKLLESLHAG